MSNPIDVKVEQPLDPLIEKLSEAIKPIADQIDGSNDYALLTFCVKSTDTDAETSSVQTLIFASGYMNVLAKGLYAELSDRLNQGDAILFALLSRVIHDLEDDHDINEDDMDVHDRASLH